MKIRLLIGGVISAVLLFLTFRGLAWGELWASLRGTNYALIVLSAVVMLGVFGLRAWRWHYLLRPVRKLSPAALFPFVMIGFFGNYVLPAKTGELVRTYALGRREHLSKSTILGSIAVEKTTDMLILFVILLGTLWAVPLPGWISDFEEGIAIVLILIVLVLFALAARGRLAANLIVRGLQFALPWWKERVARMAHSFIDGLGVLYHGASLLPVLALSAGIWLVTTAIFAVIGAAMGLDLPLYAYVIIVAITNMASLVPSAPGRLGTLEFLSVTVLALFSISSSTAALFPILLRVVQLFPILLGYFFLNQQGVHILDAEKAMEEPTATGSAPV